MADNPPDHIIRPVGIPSAEAFGTPTLMETFPHWQYFLAIESDLTVTSRYVEFNRANFATYTIEFARLLLTACAEVDVLAKLLCKRLDPQASPGDIRQYREVLLRTIRCLLSAACLCTVTAISQPLTGLQS
jgi:hypothetical protein